MNLVRTLLAVVALGALAAACDGDGGDGDFPTQTPLANEDFDSRLLTGVVLRPEDIGEGFLTTGQYSPSGEFGISFTSNFSGETLRVQSTVIRQSTVERARETFHNVRIIPVGFGAREETFTLEGADAAFLSRVNTPGGLVLVALAGQYQIYVQTSLVGPGLADPRAMDVEYIRGLTKTVVDRIAVLRATPELITPIAGGLNSPDLPTVTPSP